MLLFFAVSNNCLAQDLLYTYSFKVDSTINNEEPKDILTAIVADFSTKSKKIIGYNTFHIESKLNVTQNEFQLVLENLGYRLLTFNKTRGNVYFEEKTPPGGVNCSNASLVCNNSAITGAVTNFGVQELNAGNRGCLAGNENQSSWYYLNVQTGGSLTMTIGPNVSADDYDFAIWGPFTSATAIANCSPVSAPIRCSFASLSGNTGLATMNQGTPSGCGFLGLFSCPPSDVSDVSEGSGGDRWVMPITASAGQIYILLVDNFGASGNGYSLSFGGTSVLGCIPVILPIEVVDFNITNKNNVNLITWKTMSEKENDFFTIERKDQENNWIVIDQQNGAGNSQSETNYAFNDFNYRLQRNYYRLRQTDFNGISTISNIITIDNSSTIKTVIRITNFMGQEVESDFKGPRIIIYDDGSANRVIGN